MADSIHDTAKAISSHHCSVLKDYVTSLPKADIVTTGDFYNAASILQIEHLGK